MLSTYTLVFYNNEISIFEIDLRFLIYRFILLLSISTYHDLFGSWFVFGRWCFWILFSSCWILFFLTQKLERLSETILKFDLMSGQIMDMIKSEVIGIIDLYCTFNKVFLFYWLHFELILISCLITINYYTYSNLPCKYS